MMADPWDEKPEPVWVPRGYSSKSKIKEDDIQMLILEEMDAFHKKLMLYIGNLHQDIADHKETERNWLEQEKAYMSCIDEYKGFKIDAERMCRKLKAIQTWYDSEKGYNTPGFSKLGEILEKS